MRLLLDTHTLLWALARPERLPSAASSAIRDTANDVFVSAASTWEVAIKAALGKLDGDVAAIASAARDVGFLELPVTIAHTTWLRALPGHHRDPFDRLLVAQPLEERLTVVTQDAAFDAYEAEVLWR